MIRRRGALGLVLALTASCHLFFPHTSADAPRSDAADRARHDSRDEVRPGDAPYERVKADAARDRSTAERGPDLVASTCPTILSSAMPAQRVLGQADFVGTAANRGGTVSAATLSRPLGLGVHAGKLYVADSKNHRVLVFHGLPASDGAPADEVIGQPDFVSAGFATSAQAMNEPQGLHVDGAGLAVAEWSSHRVAFWPGKAPYGVSAVWGQPDALSALQNNGGVGPTSLRNPCFVQRVGSVAAVSDANNHRVLLFDAAQPPLYKQPASKVIGQPDMVSATSGSGTSQLNFPLGLASDGKRLVIVDGYNHRLLFYNAVPITDGASPDLIWGGLGTSATTLDKPVGAFSDGTRLFVADRGNSRVLVFKTWPSTPTQPADLVLGQPSFGEGKINQCACATASARTLNRPHFLYWDGCRLLVSDAENNRVLIY